MLQLNTIEKSRKTAIYVRISTGMQKTDRQVAELKEYSASVGISITDEDIFVDIISGFKTGEIRPIADFFSTDFDELMTNIINENKKLNAVMTVAQQLQLAA